MEHGPSGFLEFNGHMLVVDYGRIYQEGVPVGVFLEDGYLQGTSGLLGNRDGLTVIEDIPGCSFRGIDRYGLDLELPGQYHGPTGSLTYNGNLLQVVNGRVSTPNHELIGEFQDDGTFHLRLSDQRLPRRKLNESTQLTTVFEGKNSQGESFSFEFIRPLHKKDKTYVHNEIMRYFENFDGLTGIQKKYVIASLKLWAACGLLQIVRKSEGTAGLGNVKHGASGVTGVRTGCVTLDKEEFEKEIMLSKRFGPVAVVANKLKPYLEVRLNQVVSHEYGHQLEFVLSQSVQERINDLYQKKFSRSNKLHPLPAHYEGQSELLLPQQIDDRIFVSGYSRASSHEYWAECTAAFSVKESRDVLKKIDPAMYELLQELLLNPETMVSPLWADTIIDLQASLCLGGELTDDLLD